MEQPKTSSPTEQPLNSPNSSSSDSLQEIILRVQTVAEQCDGDSQALLDLLRTLETLHREIRSNLFEPSLPNTRNALYEFLKEIDESGGWPYIERMKLQAFLKMVSQNDKTSPNTQS
ncbi:hypothetical protein VB715_20590 [Crocosphaera sp. UHCC 0190]|uniref:hypothetical protein n=1 Tax=Crocosphaera sp. UHCC 0190 TaxID=3110246 RepID=UPI002B211C2C|nr:hypothetical protein [Crocosphaera sp. UHCC 0190]MEA5512176.1 hypothetical protein [Crocosphaera sp. UHCC 0190]